MYQRIPPPPGGFAGLLGRAVAAIVTLAVLVASFFVGAVVAVALIGLAVLSWTAFAIRWWWLKRRGRATMEEAARQRDSTTVEGDYSVIRERDDR